MGSRPDKILIVDDDARIRDLLRRYLTQEGLEVILAEDGKALNRILLRDTVDLIVLDLMMPGEDGLSICRRLRATSPCYHADRITKPVYIVHGTLDRAVPYRHATKMVEALKAAGKPHVFVSQDKGDHYMSHLPYRKQIYSAMETFLAQHLKA